MKAKPLTGAELREMLERDEEGLIRVRLAGTDPADVADLMDELDSGQIERVFNIMDKAVASDVMVEMTPEDVDGVVENLDPRRLAELLREMAPDDAADILNELDEAGKEEVLQELSGDERRELRKLSSYEDDSGGGLMTPELCAVPGDSTVEQAINSLARTSFSDPINVIFGVTRDRKLLGYIHISNLISKPRNALVRDVIEPNPIYCHVDEDQESIARKFRKYDLLTMPVVDHEMRLVGRITGDDVMDVLDEEAAEDMARMSGALDIEHGADSPLSIVRLRLPWLLITMFTGMVVSLIVGRLLNLKGAEAMAAFVPVILGMGGNTGMQSTAVTVRNIALGEIKFNRLMMLFMREIFVGAIMGSVCGVIAAAVVFVNLSYFGGGGGTELGYSTIRLCLIVGSSMLTAMSFAAFSGTILPILLNRMGVDPAVASGPFVTTSNDLSASLIYLMMCSVLLTL